MSGLRKLSAVLLAAAALWSLAAAFSSCVSAPSESIPSEEEPSEAVDVSPDRAEFHSREEAEEAVHTLQRVRFETGLYEPEDVLAFDLACSELIRYFRSAGEEEDYLARCFELYRAALEAKENVRYRTGDTPRVYITCSGEPGREEYIPCTVTFVDRTGGTAPAVRDTGAKIRVRGNSTAEADKKPYNIKLSENAGVFGMETGGKWALLANHYDKSLLRNKTALDFAVTAGVFSALDSRYAEVYWNGKLRGCYLVCEPVSDGKNRLNVETSNGEFLVERVKNWAGETENMFFTSRLGLRFDINYCNGNVRTVERTVNQAEEAVLSGSEEAIRECLDVDSFVNLYVVYEILKDCDMFYGNLHLCFKEGRLYCGPVWDMDLSMGNVSAKWEEEKYWLYNNVNGFGDRSGDSANGIWAKQEWFAYLMDCPFFRTLVLQKFAELEDATADLYADGGAIDRLAETYGAAFDRNYAEAGWSIAERASSYETRKRFASWQEAADDLKDWLRRRHAYLKTAYGWSAG